MVLIFFIESFDGWFSVFLDSWIVSTANEQRLVFSRLLPMKCSWAADAHNPFNVLKLGTRYMWMNRHQNSINIASSH